MRRFLTVEAPLIGTGLWRGRPVMMSTLKDLPATLLLAPIGFERAFSLVLIMLSAVLTWLLALRPADLADGSWFRLSRKRRYISRAQGVSTLQPNLCQGV
ncbi:MAG: hypothetical protein GY788_22715 [bacterium]|nr:hypothetical protein [bacterium]